VQLLEISLREIKMFASEKSMTRANIVRLSDAYRCLSLAVELLGALLLRIQ